MSETTIYKFEMRSSLISTYGIELEFGNYEFKVNTDKDARFPTKFYYNSFGSKAEGTWFLNSNDTISAWLWTSDDPGAKGISFPDCHMERIAEAYKSYKADLILLGNEE